MPRGVLRTVMVVAVGLAGLAAALVVVDRSVGVIGDGQRTLAVELRGKGIGEIAQVSWQPVHDPLFAHEATDGDCQMNTAVLLPGDRFEVVVPFSTETRGKWLWRTTVWRQAPYLAVVVLRKDGSRRGYTLPLSGPELRPAAPLVVDVDSP